MGELNQNLNRAHKNQCAARELVVDAENLAGLNPLVAAGKIKALALNAAKIARENAEVAFCLADSLEDLDGYAQGLEDKINNITKELKSRGLLNG